MILFQLNTSQPLLRWCDGSLQFSSFLVLARRCLHLSLLAKSIDGCVALCTTYFPSPYIEAIPKIAVINSCLSYGCYSAPMGLAMLLCSFRGLSSVLYTMCKSYTGKLHICRVSFHQRKYSLRPGLVGGTHRSSSLTALKSLKFGFMSSPISHTDAIFPQR